MISIITPFYNSEKYIGQAIQSVIDQNYRNWELILINDGSTDSSKNIVQNFTDTRLKYLEQPNKGVSAARNLGLKVMKGDYFCFLDSDDVLPKNSLKSRMQVFMENDDISFVDGTILKQDHKLNDTVSIWTPKFTGNPFHDLIQLTGKSFLGLTWLIKKSSNFNQQFDEKITHGEDLLFLMNLCRSGGNYSFTKDLILIYRDTPNSAMNNLKGLEKGYKQIESRIREWPNVNTSDLRLFKSRYKKMMFLAYLKSFRLVNAVKALY